MRTIPILIALLGAASIARAQAGSSLASPTTGTLGTTSTTPAPSGGFALGHATGTNMNVPPPPPASVTTPPFEQGVPPTPAPARPGLPNPPAAGGTPNTVGLDSQALAITRPGQAFGPDTVSRVQTVLSQQGFYRGPIDGQISGTTRAAIRAFQSSAGLPPTGDLDAQTASVLGALSNGIATTSTPVTPVMNPNAATTAGAGTVNNTGLPAPSTATAPATATTGGATTGTPVPTTGANVPAVAAGTGVLSYGAPGTVAPLIAITPRQQPSTSQTPPNATVTSPSGRTLDTRPFPLNEQVQSAPAQAQPVFVEP